MMLLFYFYLLGGTAERFFCPALSRISEGLKMSPNIAGVTLLALGNGSPDIFSTIAAVSQGAFASSLGSQLGAGMFVTTVVAGAVAVAAGNVHATVTRRPFLRDVGFYILALVMVFFVCWEKKIRIWQSVGFIGFYFLYVVVVILGRYIYQTRKNKRLDRLKHQQAMNTTDIVDIGPGSVDTSDFADDDELDELDEELLYANTGIPLEDSGSLVDDDASDPMLQSISRRAASPLTATSQLALRNRKIARKMKKMVYLSKFGLWGDKKMMNAASGKRPERRAAREHPAAWSEPLISDGEPNEFEEEYVRLSSILNPPVFDSFDLCFRRGRLGSQRKKSCISVLNSNWDRLLDYFEWSSMSTFSKVLFVLTLPRYLIQHTTIPWAEEGKYYRWFTVSHPLAIFGLCFTAFQLWGVEAAVGYLWMWILGVAVILTVAMILTTNDDAPPRYEPVLIVIGMVMAIVWIYFIANELVALLQAAGIIIGISNGILGITVLAWGNSVGGSPIHFFHSHRVFPDPFLGNRYDCECCRLQERTASNGYCGLLCGSNDEHDDGTWNRNVDSHLPSRLGTIHSQR
jgi:solute carrier family 24 (sodium/potassium/calcium exchanger), member 6